MSRKTLVSALARVFTLFILAQHQVSSMIELPRKKKNNIKRVLPSLQDPAVQFKDIQNILTLFTNACMSGEEETRS